MRMVISVLVAFLVAGCVADPALTAGPPESPASTPSAIPETSACNSQAYKNFQDEMADYVERGVFGGRAKPDQAQINGWIDTLEQLEGIADDRAVAAAIGNLIGHLSHWLNLVATARNPSVYLLPAARVYFASAALDRACKHYQSSPGSTS